jgi:hypothetical protein
MKDAFVVRPASANNLNSLAEWVRANSSQTELSFDPISFIELDLPRIIRGFYVHIELDDVMGNRRAFITNQPLGMVVSESIYEAASNGCMHACEVILHEVGHIFLHHKYATLGLNSAAAIYENRIKLTSTANSAEWQATTFALCVLYPYYRLKDIRTHEEVFKLYNVSCRQADRIISHITRLHRRQKHRNIKSEGKWLYEIQKSLREKNISQHQTRFQSQLLLFFSKEKKKEKLYYEEKL